MPIINENAKVGKRGESTAVAFLKKKGYRILAKNYKVSVGEIDIIAHDVKEDTLVFVEVKSRQSDDFLTPKANVHAFKQRKITQVAKVYIAKNNLDCKTRFDVLEVVGNDVNHIMCAFYAR